MSEDVHYTGKLKPTGLTVDQVMADAIFPSGYSRHDEDDVNEYFMDLYYRKKVVIGGLVFDVDTQQVADTDVFTSSKNQDGSYDFTVKYYNGGCSFNEAIEEALNNDNNNHRR